MTAVTANAERAKPFAELEVDSAPSAAWRGLRQRGVESFRAQGLPTTRMEEWRFTNVASIGRTQFTTPSPDLTVSKSDLEPYHETDGPVVVLVNGRWSDELSSIDGLPKGVRLASLATMGDSITPVGSLAQFDRHPFAALNTSFFDDALVLELDKGVVVEQPLYILSVAVTESGPTAFFPRLFVRVAESSQVTLVEQHLTVGEGKYLTAPVTEFALDANAVVDHYRVQRESTSAYHLGLTHVHQQTASAFASHAITWGGAVVRNDVVAELDGEGADSILNGLYMVEGNQLVDNHMRVEHCQANTTSHELYKGIMEGRSRAVFNGRIFVHKGAQKTDAKQTNRNLLLSEEAIVNSNPQLEIFADDVKCTHGSTIGQLDPQALFYLRSRGIGEVAARSLLTYAFASDIVSRVKVEKTRIDLEEILFRRLPRGEVVRQAV